MTALQCLSLALTAAGMGCAAAGAPILGLLLSGAGFWLALRLRGAQ